MKRPINIAMDSRSDSDAHVEYLFDDKACNGALSFSYRDEKFGSVNYSENRCRGAIITNWDGVLVNDSKISAETPIDLLSMHFLTSGEMLNSAKGVKPQHMKCGMNNIWSTPQGNNGDIVIPSNMHVSTFGIIFRKQFLEELANRYPDLLSDLFNRYTTNTPFKLFEDSIFSSSEMNNVIHQIKNSFLMGNASDMYVEAKIIELLALQLDGANYGGRVGGEFLHCKTSADVDRMFEVKNILNADLLTPPTTLELSKTIGMNEKKLRCCFKEVFNNSIYNFILESRMLKATELLKNTDYTILEVAENCGYDYASHFTTAFKRFKGVTPMQFRKCV